MSSIFKILTVGPRSQTPIYVIVDADDPGNHLYAVGDGGQITDRFYSKQEAGDVFKAWRAKTPLRKKIRSRGRVKTFLGKGWKKDRSEYLRPDGSPDIVDELGKQQEIEPVPNAADFRRFFGRAPGKLESKEWVIVPSRTWQGAQRLYIKANPSAKSGGSDQFYARNLHTELLLLAKKIMGWPQASGVHVRDLPTKSNIGSIMKKLDSYLPEDLASKLRTSSLDEFCELVLGALDDDLVTLMTDVYKTVEETEADVTTAVRIFKFLMGQTLKQQDVRAWIKKNVPQTKFHPTFLKAFWAFVKILRTKKVKKNPEFTEAKQNLLTVVQSYLKSQGERLEDPYKKYTVKKLEEKIHKDVAGPETKAKTKKPKAKAKKLVRKEKLAPVPEPKPDEAEEPAVVDPLTRTDKPGPRVPSTPLVPIVPDEVEDPMTGPGYDDGGVADGDAKDGFKMEPSPEEPPEEKARPVFLDDEAKAVQKQALLDDEQAAATVAMGKVCIAAGAGSGKCVTGDTLVTTTSGVKRIDACSGDDLLVSVDAETLAVSTEKATWLDMGVSPVLELETESGIKLRATPEHPLLTWKDEKAVWTKLEDMTTEDRVFVLIGHATQEFGSSFNKHPVGDCLPGRAETYAQYTLQYLLGSGRIAKLSMTDAETPHFTYGQFGTSCPADRRFRLDRVVSIKDAGEQRVYDFTVPMTHSFIANSIVSHNTRVLTSRVKYFIDKGYKPSQILTTTFSRKAADEMNKRLKEQFNIDDTLTGTTHSISGKIIRKYRPELIDAMMKATGGTPGTLMKMAIKQIEKRKSEKSRGSQYSKYSPFWKDAAGQWFNLGEKPFDENGEAIGGRRLSRVVDQFKNEGVGVKRAWNQNRDRQNGLLMYYGAAVYGAYEWLKRNDPAMGPCMDFTDWILEARAILKNNPQALDAMQKQYKIVMVDEAQDQNSIQNELFGMIGAKADSYAMIGDDKQAIYSFRGAKPEHFINLKNEGFDVKSITTNYRSGKAIVDAANKLIAHNGDRQIPMTCNANEVRKGMGSIRVQTTPTHEDAAAFTSSEIADAVKSGASPSDYGIAVRNNAEADAYCLGLMARGIPFRAKLDFFKKPAVKALLAWMKFNLTTNEKEINEAVMEAHVVPGFRLSRAFMSGLAQKCPRGQSYYDYLRSGGGSYGGKSSWRNTKYQDLYVMAIDKIKSLTTANTIEVVQAILDIKGVDMTFREYLVDQIDPEDLAEDVGGDVSAVTPDMVEQAAMVPVKPVLEMAASFEDPKKFYHFLQKMQRANDKNYHDVKKEDREPAVQVTTVHGWKGLEAPHMYVSMAGGTFPNFRSDAAYENGDETAYDSERRLAYVALTRGEDSVTVMSPEENYLGKEAPRSRFIDEACIGIGDADDALPDDKTKEAATDVKPPRSWSNLVDQVKASYLQPEGLDQ